MHFLTPSQPSGIKPSPPLLSTRRQSNGPLIDSSGVFPPKVKETKHLRQLNYSPLVANGLQGRGSGPHLLLQSFSGGQSNRLQPLPKGPRDQQGTRITIPRGGTPQVSIHRPPAALPKDFTAKKGQDYSPFSRSSGKLGNCHCSLDEGSSKGETSSRQDTGLLPEEGE